MEYQFPRLINSPMMLIVFESDEVGIAMVCVAIIYAVGILSFPVAIGLFWLYRRIKRNYPRGFIKHLVYMSGLSKMPGYPVYFQSQFGE